MPLSHWLNNNVAFEYQFSGKFLDLSYTSTFFWTNGIMILVINCNFDYFWNHFACNTTFNGLTSFLKISNRVIGSIHKLFAQDEVRDPRQVLARPTWVADKESGATVQNGLEKIWVAPSVWPMAILVCSVWRIPIIRSVRSGQYPYFCLFCLANTHISVCSVWPIPNFKA